MSSFTQVTKRDIQMTAQVTRDKLNQEEVMDDVSNSDLKIEQAIVAPPAPVVATDATPVSVDEEKLAKLRARLAAKTKEAQETQAPKMVKKEKSINFGVVGSGQAGCVDGTTNIYVSGDGIITIEELFNKSISSARLENIEVTGGGNVCVHIESENVYTVSIDPETGVFKKAKVNAVWKNRVCSKNKITTNDGSFLICSKNHPSLVFRPNSRRKAFFAALANSKPLTVGDNLVDTRLEVLDMLSEKTYVREIEVTNDIGWLLGAFAGDGHNKLSGNDISFYSDNDMFTQKIIDVCEKLPHTSISVNDQPGCKQVSVYGLQFRLFIETAYEHSFDRTYGGFGGKTYTIGIPSCITAASSEVRASFLAGLIDSDGTIANDWCETSVSTSSANLADKIGCLVSSIGGRSAVEVIQPRRLNEEVGYRVRLSGKLNHGPMAKFIAYSLGHSSKNSKLNAWLDNEQKSFATSIVPLKFGEIQSWLKDAGMTTVNNLSVNSSTNLKTWARGDSSLSINTFDKMMSIFKDNEQLSYVNKLAPKLLPIENVEIVDEKECTFFDLTVDTYENYVAGNNGLIFTHNSRLSETFYKLGYDAVAINTAQQDLKFIDLPESNKLHMEHGIGGAAKELEIGKQAAEKHREQIAGLISTQLADAQILILALSLGGGSGAGSCETLVDVLSQTGKPICVITVLPMESEDSQTKANALKTLSKLSGFAKDKKIANLIVVDNAKIESIYHDVSQVDFFSTANRAIVEPIDVFNTLSAMDSKVKPLDPMEWAKLLVDGEGLSVYGTIKVSNYQEEDAIATAIFENLNGNLLAGGFDLKQSKYVGVLVAANATVWKSITAATINYALALVDDQCGHPNGVFKGIYTIDTSEDCVYIYSMFNGLGLPAARVEQLKKDAAALAESVKTKDTARNLTLHLDTGTDQAVSKVQEMKNKIAQKGSAFGKLSGTKVIDRRK